MTSNKIIVQYKNNIERQTAMMDHLKYVRDIKLYIVYILSSVPTTITNAISIFPYASASFGCFFKSQYKPLTDRPLFGLSKWKSISNISFLADASISASCVRARIDNSKPDVSLC